MRTRKHLFLFLALVCGSLVPVRSWALDPEPFTLPVSFSFRVSGVGCGIMEIQDGVSGNIGFSYEQGTESPVGTAWMKPGKTYTLEFQYSGISDYWMSLVAPNGYQFYVDGVPKDLVYRSAGGERHDYYSIELRPVFEGALAQGSFTGIDIGQAVSWELGLGTSRAGHTVGRVGFREHDLSGINPATRDRLLYVPPINSTQVNIVWDGPSSSRIRQIVTPRIMVDFVDVTNGYEVRYYNYDDTNWVPATPIYTIKSGKTPWRTIFVEAPAGTTNQLRITETDETSSTTARVSHLTLSSGSVASGTYVWTLQEGGPSGNWLRTTTHSSVVSGGTRENTVTVREGGASGTIVSKTKYVYQTYAWGEDLYQVIANPNGGSSASTTTYAYHDTAPTATSETWRGNYRRVKSISDSTGKWTAMEYYDDWIKRGQLKYRYQPYLDTPGTVTLNPTQGRVTYFEYAADTTGRQRRPALEQSFINGVETGKTAWTYDDSANSGLARIKANVDRYHSTGTAYLRTHTESIDPITADLDESGEPCVLKNPDGTQISWSRSAGDFNLTTRAFTVGTSGLYWRAIKVHGTSVAGTANGAEATAQSSYREQSFDPIYLVPYKSTMEIVMLDYAGMPLRTETRIYTGAGTWSDAVGYVDSDYDFIRTNRLKSQTASNGAATSYYYTDGRLSSTVADGVETQFTYDAIGRTLTTKKIGAPASGIHAEQKDITTTFNYNATDGSNYATIETVSTADTTETIVSAKAYDRAGRVIKVTPPGLSPTTISYAPASRTQTTTAPDGGTTVAETYRDGSPKSTTGTAVVAQYYSYSVESDGRQLTQVNLGTSNSTRLQKNWTDKLGRPLKLEKPGFSQTNQAAYVEEQFYHATTGQLIKSTRSGAAATLYEYNALGQVKRSGLDVTSSSDTLVLASMDRITDADTSFELIGSAWWTKATTTTYPDANAATHPITTISRTRLSGFGTGVRFESQTTDAENNTVTTVTTRNGKLATTRTTVPGLTSDAYAYTYNDLDSAATGHDGLTNKVEYDPLGRRAKTYDTRDLATTTAYYTGTTLAYTVKDATGTIVGTTGYTTAGRVAWTQDALSKTTRFTYNQRGQLTAQWGDGSYPISYVYDANYGERTGMSTYRSAPAADSASWPAVGTADTTSWFYDTPTGMLWKKTDAANKSVVFGYDSAGRMARRTWARGVYVDYTYDNATNELLTQTYSDGTPTVTHTYTRSGQADSTTDAAGTWDYVYDPAKPWRMSATGLPAHYGTRTVTPLYESTGMVGRYLGFQLGASAGDAADLEQRYTYSADGRFDTLATKRNSNTVSRTFDYAYLTNAPFVSALSITGGHAFTLTRGYETSRNLLASIEGKWGADPITRNDYTSDARGQRTTAKQSGSAYADYYVSGSYSAVYNRYLYNARGELESAAMYRGDTPSLTPAGTDELPGHRFEYRFDSIGNRKNDGPTGDPSNSDDQYTTNALNQYTTKENNAVRFLGSAAPNANVGVAGSSSTAKRDRAWGSDLVPANTTSAVKATANVYAAIPGGGSGGSDLVRTDSRTYLMPKAVQAFAYDEDGNLTSDGIWDYSYDAENRLTAIQNRSEAIGTGMIAAGDARRIVFKYDHQGRRISKTTFGGWNGTYYSSTQISQIRYLYDGWNLIAEFNADASNNLTLTRSYTWGLDLTGDLTASGGVGALLQIHDHGASKTLLATYDGNGNLAALLNADSGALEAAYEYDPFGNLLRVEGPYAATNPFRFSTKYTDNETGLVYYGLRYYSPSLGRFINRDTLGEKGGVNLYGFTENNPLNSFDYLGMITATINGAKYDVSAIPGVAFNPRSLPGGTIWTSNPGSWGLSWSVLLGTQLGFGVGYSSGGYIAVAKPITPGLTPLPGYSGFSPRLISTPARPGARVTYSSDQYTNRVALILEFDPTVNLWVPVAYANSPSTTTPVITPPPVTPPSQGPTITRPTPWTSADLFNHFTDNSGRAVTLSEIGLEDTIRNASITRSVMGRFAEQIKQKAIKEANALGVGTHAFEDSFNNSYDFTPVVWAIGGATLRGSFVGTFSLNSDGSFSFGGSATIHFYDYFNDPYDIGEMTGIDVNLPGTPYNISGDWTESFAGGGNLPRLTPASPPIDSPRVPPARPPQSNNRFGGGVEIER